MRPTRIAFALALLGLASIAVAGPSVSNVTFAQQSDGAGGTEVVVNYDLLTPGGPSTVTLLGSDDGGATFNITPVSVTGDVGPGVTTGTMKLITWDIATDLPDTDLPNAAVRVFVEDGSPIPLVITSDASADVHQDEAQTLIFTFDEDVTGFDASDVTVTGGTAGTFTPISATSYTLDVTGAGGTVTASVAGGAASSVASGTTTAGDTFSNFYQDTWTLDLDGGTTLMELIRIPAGTFTMGSPVGELSREDTAGFETQHEVTISQDFYLGKTEVTQAQWLAIEGSWPGTAPSAGNGLGNSFPAYYVSHNDIQTFMTDLDTAIAEPGVFSLPTESQWEYACRAGTSTRFNFGDGFGTDEDCSAEAERTNSMWYCGNSGSKTNLVGQKSANAWGLRDMHGNVWEWCADFADTYPAGPLIDPTGPATGLTRLVRGGSWRDYARSCRSAARGETAPAGQHDSVGFRVLAVR